MTEYRMYTLDRLGRIGLAEAVIATGDEEALYKVRKLARNAKRCELWKGNRLVASRLAADARVALAQSARPAAAAPSAASLRKLRRCKGRSDIVFLCQVSLYARFARP